MQHEETIDLHWIPSSVTGLDISESSFLGRLTRSGYRNAWFSLSIERNKLGGTYNTTELPRTLCGVAVSQNQLCDSLNLIA